jgi:hypothetical protein
LYVPLAAHVSKAAINSAGGSIPCIPAKTDVPKNNKPNNNNALFKRASKTKL